MTLVLPDELTKELRIRVVEVYNVEKGALGEGVADAIRLVEAADSEDKIDGVPRNSHLHRQRFKSHRSCEDSAAFVPRFSFR